MTSDFFLIVLRGMAEEYAEFAGFGHWGCPHFLMLVKLYDRIKAETWSFYVL